MPEAHIYRSVHEIGREQWEREFPDVLEGYDYLAAVETADLSGFSWRYIAVREGERLRAFAPAFVTDYALDTTLTAFGRNAIAAVRQIAPRAFTVKLGAIGSPCTETAGLIFADDASEADRRELAHVLLAGFEAEARQARCGLIAIKDAPTADDLIWGASLRESGFSKVAGLPSAHLDIDFPDVDAYLSRLSAATRKDMRRKLKALEAVSIEVRADIHNVIARVIDLYRQTRDRADMQFEELTEAYFTGVLSHMPGRSMCVLYRARTDGELLAANLLIHDRETLLDKFFCMEAARGKELNLYFISWVTNIRLCLEHGLQRYQSGQAGYDAKIRLGSRLSGASMFFKHRNPVLNRALRWSAPLLSEKQPEGA